MAAADMLSAPSNKSIEMKFRVIFVVLFFSADLCAFAPLREHAISRQDAKAQRYAK
jgi:hypothetical protein